LSVLRIAVSDDNQNIWSQVNEWAGWNGSAITTPYNDESGGKPEEIRNFLRKHISPDNSTETNAAHLMALGVTPEDFGKLYILTQFAN
jgi:hypothetical protein